ncbi:MAG: glycosyltransferase family 2 protein [Planctomycetota bacterium]
MAVVDVSFIILCWNSRQHLDGVLSSIVADLSAAGQSFEVIVIDNGSRDDSLAYLREWQQRLSSLVVVPLGCNTGTTFSRNIGLRMARGRTICVLDSDITFSQPQTLRRLIDVLDKYPQAGIVAPSLVYPSGNYQKSCDRFPTVMHKIKRRLFLRQMEAAEARRWQELHQHAGGTSSDGGTAFFGDALVEPGRIDPQVAREVPYAISAFWVFRRSLIDSIGLLDDNIFYAPEDADYCLRAWLAGWWVLHVSSVQATHHAQEISRKKLFSRSSLSHTHGLLYYFWKHRYAFRLSGLLRRVRTAVRTWKPD